MKTKMNPKNLIGLYTFRNNISPECYAYSNDLTGNNIPTDNNGIITNWIVSNNIFNFTEERENEIDDIILKQGYCIFKSINKVIFSEWQMKK